MDKALKQCWAKEQRIQYDSICIKFQTTQDKARYYLGVQTCSRTIERGGEGSTPRKEGQGREWWEGVRGLQRWLCSLLRLTISGPWIWLLPLAWWIPQGLPVTSLQWVSLTGGAWVTWLYLTHKESEYVVFSACFVERSPCFPGERILIT